MDKNLKLFREKAIELFLSDLESYKKRGYFLNRIDDFDKACIFKFENNNYNYYYIDITKYNKDKNSKICSEEEFKNNYLKNINFENIFENDKLCFYYDSKHKNLFNFASKLGDNNFYNYIFANFVKKDFIYTHNIKPGFNIDFFQIIKKTNENKTIFKSFLNFIINEIDLVDNQQLSYKNNTYYLYNGLFHNQIENENDALFIKEFLSHLKLDVLDPKDKNASDFLKYKITSKYFHLFKEEKTIDLFSNEDETLEIKKHSFNSYVFRDNHIMLIDYLPQIISSIIKNINENAEEININKIEFFSRKNPDESLEHIFFIYKENGLKELFPLNTFISDSFEYIHNNINEKDLSSYNNNTIDKHIEKFLEQYILKSHLSYLNNKTDVRSKFKI